MQDVYKRQLNWSRSRRRDGNVIARQSGRVGGRRTGARHSGEKQLDDRTHDGVISPAHLIPDLVQHQRKGFTRRETNGRARSVDGDTRWRADTARYVPANRNALQGAVVGARDGCNTAKNEEERTRKKGKEDRTSLPSRTMDQKERN